MNRREFLRNLTGMAAAGIGLQILPGQSLSAATIPPSASDPAGKKPNVLFIAIDDLRPQLGCYGEKMMITPNMDRLAAEGALFTHTYCQQSVCSPSRSSVLTGMRPDTTKVYDLHTHFRKALPDVVTLPQHFKNHGYHSVGISKIYHPKFEDEPSWSEPWISGKGVSYALKENMLKDTPETSPADPEADTQPVATTQASKAAEKPRKGLKPQGASWECADVPDNTYTDGITADKAVDVLLRIKDKPFYFAVGFLKPHLPFVAPKKYWDLYDEETLASASTQSAPIGAPSLAVHNSGELRAFKDIPKGNKSAVALPESLQRKLIHGYYACCSYVDAQVGRVLQALEDEGLKENTIVILWGDHGWHLGDHALWGKHTNFERGTRSPMMIRVPGMKQAGVRIDGLTEFVDIYPSLCELAGLPLPENLEGTSFAPLLDAPDRSWKKAAFSQFPRPEYPTPVHMGYSMRTERYRYTEWRRIKTDEVDATELYDYENDPEETVNLAAEENPEDLIRQLSAQLRAGWQAAAPDGA